MNEDTLLLKSMVTDPLIGGWFVPCNGTDGFLISPVQHILLGPFACYACVSLFEGEAGSVVVSRIDLERVDFYSKIHNTELLFTESEQGAIQCMSAQLRRPR